MRRMSEPLPTPISNDSVVLEELTRDFDGTRALDRVSLRVRRGEFFGFLGPNGAGKSTTIKILCGLLRPTSGRATVLGHDVERDALEVKRRIGVLPEEINVYERLTADELLRFSGRMHGLDDGEIDRRAVDLYRLMELSEEDRHRLVVDDSMGTKKKVVLACALLHNPKVLFLDEPFNGIDAVTARAIRTVLTNATERGVTVFFSSHVLEVVEKLCTRLAIIHRGRIRAMGTLDEIRATAGTGEGSSLEDAFVDLVGGRTERGDLDWMS
jgi:ABC-2 type transport system ATP-binding protein